MQFYAQFFSLLVSTVCLTFLFDQHGRYCTAVIATTISLSGSFCMNAPVSYRHILILRLYRPRPCQWHRRLRHNRGALGSAMPVPLFKHSRKSFSSQLYVMIMFCCCGIHKGNGHKYNFATFIRSFMKMSPNLLPSYILVKVPRCTSVPLDCFSLLIAKHYHLHFSSIPRSI